MENTKSVKSIKKDKQIVKLNKKKIIIIVFLIIVILAGISVGLYFAIRPDKVPMPGNITWEKNEKKLKKDFEKHGQEGITGVYFGANDSDEAELALYGETDLSDEEKTIIGPFSTYLEELPEGQITWYGIQEPSAVQAGTDMEDFFYSGEDEYGSPEVKWDHAIFLGEAYDSAYVDAANGGDGWNQVDISYIPESSETTTTDTGETTTTSDTDDNDYQLSFEGYGTSITAPTAPAWLWFNDGELIAITSGLQSDTDDNDQVILGDDISDEYFNKIQEMIESQDLTVYP